MVRSWQSSARQQKIHNGKDATRTPTCSVSRIQRSKQYIYERRSGASALGTPHQGGFSHTLQASGGKKKRYNIKYRDLHKKQPPSHGDVQARMVTPSLGQRHKHMEWLQGGLHAREEDEGWRVTRTSHQRKQQLSAKHLHARVENTSSRVTIPTAINSARWAHPSIQDASSVEAVLARMR